MQDNPIDIVLPWVDGNNPEWQARYKQYAPMNSEGDQREIRFRDWNLLKYWFRGIEEFAPWVRTIHFVTSGEVPDWLNQKHPKLNWVKHEDFMPSKYLPTFNINAIETNIHRIEGLSEQFIFFNDDLFLLRSVEVKHYFRNNLPCDCAILDPIFPKNYPGIFVNAVSILNKYFDKKEVIRSNFGKWITPKYGKYLMKSLLLLPWKKFPGILNPHLSQPFCKSTFDELWNAEAEALNNTGENKSRMHQDVNQWLFRYWHLAKGNFVPYNKIASGVCLDISENNVDEICRIITNKSVKEICINDSAEIQNFTEIREKIEQAFITILPTKSLFEK